MKTTIEHYDLLIDEGNDPLLDPPELQCYMDKWDGELFLELLELNKSKNVLEIGCGTGRLMVKVAPCVNSLFGIDISPKTVSAAKEHLKDYNAKLVCDDFLTYPFETKFDLIYSSLTFMHIENKHKAIEKISELLYDNGICVVSLDKNKNDILDYGTRKIKLFPDDPDFIIELFQKFGFTEIKKYETEFAHLIKVKRFKEVKL